MVALWLIPFTWLLGVAGLLFYYRRTLWALWDEPILRHPVLIVESDDWGAGPPETQAQALDALKGVLTQHRDSTGRPAVMTLALILAVPDGAAIRRDRSYRRQVLDDPAFALVLAAIERGREAGVFAPQLHGLEHYWPATLMAAGDDAVKAWLESATPAATEELPSHLQTRWVDASALPSRPLSTDQIKRAAAEEVAVFERVLGEKPRVVVPPTFVWTPEVEPVWAEEGIEVLVTPGWRYRCRDGEGRPGCRQGPLWNGQSAGKLSVVVRSDYFEPLRDRGAAHALGALDRAVAEGRPCLLENHRDNFIGDREQCARSIAELDTLYRQACARHERLRFLSTLELGRILASRDRDWIEGRPARRLAPLIQRLRRTGRLWRLLRLSGVAWALSLLPRMLRSAAPAP